MRNVYKRPAEVADRLRELDLDEELLLRAARAGLLAWFECTPNDPPSFPGISAWAWTVRSLREELLPRGWERFNDRNLPLTVNRARNVAVTASSGDECTGIEELQPRTRNPKGVTTQQKVKDNAEQLGLFADAACLVEELVAEVEKGSTWLLLSYRDYGRGVLRCELSRPVGIGTDGRVDGWNERIILSETPFDGDEVLLRRGGGGENGNDAGKSTEFDDGAATVDVEVKRRA